MATESKKPADGVELDVPSAHQRYLDSLLGEESKDREAPVYGGKSIDPKVNRVATEDGYVATDPIYQNHANDTEKPYAADGGADQLAEEAFAAAVEGEPVENEQLTKLYGEVSNTREDGETVGGEAVHATVSPPAPEDNENAGVTSGATGAPSVK